ncbi:hypothetical protein [Candidatus Marinarcus aquaticus]|uniref:Uncharacterized protein n=1 Tax=Candidatus Marinarcus aquaticus TaxID=2044504 RepID=A0A4Q0XTJ0_9BACT|nr:hypothetical protein [Candidatus Marinarcus aquaticus]RXJ60897.1 hypothetical protein CRV04_02475 [Candidatus Marinarcus aquaticus]
MSSINDIVDSFNTGFFSKVVTTEENPMELDVKTPKELSGFEEKMNVVSTEKSPPPPTTSVALDGFTYNIFNRMVPAKIIIEGVHAQELFFDKNGNWDVEAEAESYKQKELAHKTEFIENWIKDNGYAELQNKAELMKALLAKTEL